MAALTPFLSPTVPPLLPQKSRIGTVLSQKRHKSGRALSAFTQKLDRASFALVQHRRKMLGTRDSAVASRAQAFTGASLSSWSCGPLAAASGSPGS